MTDEIPHHDPSNAIVASMTEHEEHCRRRAECRPANKEALFDALAAAGITRVIVRFDGYGDSGQVESIDPCVYDDLVELPDKQIDYVQPAENGQATIRRTIALQEAIETLAYEALEETHWGWMNNDGAFGDFEFDVASRTITLSYDERYVDTYHDEHVF
jgi:hypothetical protein